MHEAFIDKSVDGIITVIGGFNSNQLLRYIDFELIKNNPKFFCGYSDITILQNAMLVKAGLVTFSGPHFSTFAIEKHLDFTIEHFKKMLFEDEKIKLTPSKFWSDDAWYLNQNDRNLISNEGYKIINEGSKKASGTIVGGNLCTFNLLQGSEFMPSLKDTILFLEDDEIVGKFTDVEVDRNLQSLINLPAFNGVKGILIGRFQKNSQMTIEKVTKIIKSKKELQNIPVIYNLDFGHTDPLITFPVGGVAEILIEGDSLSVTISKK